METELAAVGTGEQAAPAVPNGPLPAVQLARHFDTERLRDELDRLGTSAFNVQRSFAFGEVEEGAIQDWRVLSLRSPGGEAGRTDPGGPGLVDYAYTPYSRQAPYMTSLLQELPANLRTARLMSLAPGAEVDEHCDIPYGLPAGWVRLHVPIVTNPGAVLVIDGEEHCWQPGTLWYGDFGRPHSVANRGAGTRVHLVVDCYVSRQLLTLFPDEFVSRVAWSEALLERETVPLCAVEREAMACDVMVPASFLPDRFYLLPAPGHAPDVPGRLRVLDDQLVLQVDDGTEMALVHIGEGEFRPLCWTTERTIKLDLAGTAPVVRFRVRFGSGLTEYVRTGTAAMAAARAS